ncbi:Uncharacterised protein [uncultured archaeon]|nr:Uncharacterised protein [uncultured archaeon]
MVLGAPITPGHIAEEFLARNGVKCQDLGLERPDPFRERVWWEDLRISVSQDTLQPKTRVQGFYCTQLTAGFKMPGNDVWQPGPTEYTPINYTQPFTGKPLYERGIKDE